MSERKERKKGDGMRHGKTHAAASEAIEAVRRHLGTLRDGDTVRFYGSQDIVDLVRATLDPHELECVLFEVNDRGGDRALSSATTASGGVCPIHLTRVAGARCGCRPEWPPIHVGDVQGLPALDWPDDREPNS